MTLQHRWADVSINRSADFCGEIGGSWIKMLEHVMQRCTKVFAFGQIPQWHLERRFCFYVTFFASRSDFEFVVFTNEIFGCEPIRSL